MAFDPQEAVEFMRLVGDAESENRVQGLDDLRFSYGEQWDSATINSRRLESRPYLTINKVDAYIRQVTNNQRQQRPRMKASPMDGFSDPKTAEIMTGLLRHIQLQSDADQAYDTAFNFAARIGWGYFRVMTDYIREDSFDQDIYIEQVENPFTVYLDPNSSLPDGSDAERCLVTDMISKDEFKRLYPGAQESGFVTGDSGDDTSEWLTKEDIRIGEYFTIEKEKSKLVMLSNQIAIYEDQLPKDPSILRNAGIQIIGSRSSYKRTVEWRKVSGFEVLDSKKWAGRFIPIVPVYGDQVIIDGKRDRFGLVRFSRDPQKMYNFWRTAMTESIAMAPKAKWLMAEGQDEGHENEWNQANVSATATLRYKQTDVDGRSAPAPQRLQPEPPPSGAMEAASAISNDLQTVLGIFDPETNVSGGGPKSGRAVRAEQQQSEMGNFHLYDNLTRSLNHCGRIILDLIPKIYDSQRIMRIIGDDGKPDLVTINESQDQEAIGKIENDVTVGNYDIIMETGPGYNSKRAESVDALMSLVSSDPTLMQTCGDLIFRNMDFPGADIIADRLASANPLSQVDEQSEVPPAVQMQIKQLQTQLQQAMQHIQQQEQVIKSRSDLKQMEESAETQREHMRLVVKAHDTESWVKEERDQFNAQVTSKAHESAIGYKKAMDVEEVRAQLALLLARMGDIDESKDGALRME